MKQTYVLFRPPSADSKTTPDVNCFFRLGDYCHKGDVDVGQRRGVGSTAAVAVAGRAGSGGGMPPAPSVAAGLAFCPAGIPARASTSLCAGHQANK